MWHVCVVICENGKTVQHVQRQYFWYSLIVLPYGPMPFQSYKRLHICSVVYSDHFVNLLDFTLVMLEKSPANGPKILKLSSDTSASEIIVCHLVFSGRDSLHLFSGDRNNFISGINPLCRDFYQPLIGQHHYLLPQQGKPAKNPTRPSLILFRETVWTVFPELML